MPTDDQFRRLREADEEDAADSGDYGDAGTDMLGALLIVAVCACLVIYGWVTLL